MKTINISQICGNEVLSRSNIRNLYSNIDTSTLYLDFDNVSFISRSAADELCEILSAHPDIDVINLSEEVSTMIEIVKKGRASRRDLASKAKVSMTVNCRSMDDLRRALLSFGL